MFQTVLFDLDGTLLNTIADLAAAGNHVCRENGWPEYSVDEFRTMVGHGIRNLVTRFTPESCRDAETLDRAYRQFSAYYGTHSMDQTVPYPGIPELLERLQTAGVQLAVCSNKADDFSPRPDRAFLPRALCPGGGQAGGGAGEAGPGHRAPDAGGFAGRSGPDPLCGRQCCGHPDRPQRRPPGLRRHLGLPVPAVPGGGRRGFPGRHRGGLGADDSARILKSPMGRDAFASRPIFFGCFGENLTAGVG